MPSSVFGELEQPTRVKIIFKKKIIWDRDCKKRKETRSSMLLSDANRTKETRVKQASKVYHSRVLRHVKAQHSQLSHMN